MENYSKMPQHYGPYVKNYDENGILTNPITKPNPYFVRPKSPKTKIRKWHKGMRIQIIPVFKNKKGETVKLSTITWEYVNGKPFSPGMELVGIKKIAHKKVHQ